MIQLKVLSLKNSIGEQLYSVLIAGEFYRQGALDIIAMVIRHAERQIGGVVSKDRWYLPRSANYCWTWRR